MALREVPVQLAEVSVQLVEASAQSPRTDEPNQSLDYGFGGQELPAPSPARSPQEPVPSPLPRLGEPLPRSQEEDAAYIRMHEHSPPAPQRD